jgi:hypothetical protein
METLLVLLAQHMHFMSSHAICRFPSSLKLKFILFSSKPSFKTETKEHEILKMVEERDLQIIMEACQSIVRMEIRIVLANFLEIEFPLCNKSCQLNFHLQSTAFLSDVFLDFLSTNK